MISAKLYLRPIDFRAIAGALGAVLLTILNTLVASAQSYPNQVIKIVVPFTAGGAVDGEIKKWTALVKEKNIHVEP
jgi:tripartite-type tricarboxylate transporter receptor subunit TctC